MHRIVAACPRRSTMPALHTLGAGLSWSIAGDECGPARGATNAGRGDRTEGGTHPGFSLFSFLTGTLRSVPILVPVAIACRLTL